MFRGRGIGNLLHWYDHTPQNIYPTIFNPQQMLLNPPHPPALTWTLYSLVIENLQKQTHARRNINEYRIPILTNAHGHCPPLAIENFQMQTHTKANNNKNAMQMR